MHHSGAWGYHFDVQTRHLYYPASWPNAIAACFAIRGLLDAYDWGVLPDGPERASRARPFLESLFRESEHGPFFAYVSAGSELIHNANVMVRDARAAAQPPAGPPGWNADLMRRSKPRSACVAATAPGLTVSATT